MQMVNCTSDRVIVEDGTWKDVPNPSNVICHIVDNNPLQVRSRGSGDDLTLYLYKSQQTYVGTLIIRLSVSFLRL